MTAEAPATLRTFVAIELPDGVKEGLAAAQRAWRAAAGPGGDVGGGARDGVRGAAVKWVEPAGIHLTLKFLGATPAHLVADIERELEWGLTSVRAFRLELGEAGVFPGPRAPRVLWVGLRGDLETLGRVGDITEATIAPLGYPTEARPFAPHLTLGRVREDARPEERRRLGEAVARLRPPTASFVVDAVSLIRSERGPAGARYTRLFALPLRHPKPG